MEITTLPVQISAQTLSPGDVADTSATSPLPLGQVLPQDIFAALLARQLGVVPDEALVGTGDSGSVKDPDALTADNENPLPGELVLPALIAGLVGAQPARDQQPDIAEQNAIVGKGSAEVLPVLRQPVAAVSAAFAGKAADVQADSSITSFPVVDAAAVQGALANNPVAGLQTAPAAPAAPAVATQLPAGVIPQPVTSQAWGDALGDRVIWMVGQQHQGAELHLNPPSLGPLEIKLSMNDGQASLTFSTHHLPVREAIEAATPRLREMFGESGISLGSVSVNVGSFSQQQPGEQAQANRNPQNWTPSLSEPGFGAMLPAAVTALGRNNGMVDVFA